MHLYSNTTGDPSTLDALILSCVEPVNRMAYKYCRTGSDHEDFVSIGMLKVCEVAAHAQAQAQARITDLLGYLCRVAQNAMIDECNRLRRLEVVSLDAPLSEDCSGCLADFVPDSSTSATVAPETDERIEALQSALERLTAHQRTAVLLRAGLPGYGAHTVQETARSLRISADAVQSTIQHSRRKLARDARLCESLGLEVVR